MLVLKPETSQKENHQKKQAASLLNHLHISNYFKVSSLMNNYIYCVCVGGGGVCTYQLQTKNLPYIQLLYIFLL